MSKKRSEEILGDLKSQSSLFDNSELSDCDRRQNELNIKETETRKFFITDDLNQTTKLRYYKQNRWLESLFVF